MKIIPLSKKMVGVYPFSSFLKKALDDDLNDAKQDNATTPEQGKIIPFRAKRQPTNDGQ